MVVASRITCIHKFFSSLIVNAIWSSNIKNLFLAGTYAAYNHRWIANGWPNYISLQVTFNNF